jgi:hypothetical protein
VLRRCLSVSVPVAILCFGCTSTYQARFDAAPDQWPALRADIAHCLTSLAFRDVSSEDLYPKFMEEDPTIVEVWAPIDGGSFFSTPPVAVAWVIQEEAELYVHFQPPNSQGDDANYLANTFSTCVQVHHPDATVNISSRKIVPDLR